MNATTAADLRRQHLEFVRTGYDGHNRRSGITSMARLSVRRRRRRLHCALRNLRDRSMQPGRLAAIFDSANDGGKGALAELVRKQLEQLGAGNAACQASTNGWSRWHE